MSIVITHPDIAKEWHPTKNDVLKPEDVSFGSDKKVWWLCRNTCSHGCLHEYEQIIGSRTRINSGCPYCCVPSKKVCIHNSILITNAEISKQWHPIKNGYLKPENYSVGSGKKIWWLCDKKCPQGCLHEWEAVISSRNRCVCPYCSKSKICIHDSIYFTHPDIVKQWHPTKNLPLKSSDISFGSDKKVWWLCDKKCPQGCLHEWEASVLNRCKKGDGICQYCSGKKICKHTSFAGRFPDISKEFHPTKNKKINLEEISYGNNDKVWWLCPNTCSHGCLHEYECSFNTRTRGQGCPFCSNPPKQFCKHSTFKFTHPDLAKQWHPTKNECLDPNRLSYGSNKVAWWLCPNTCSKGCLHEWEVSINHRTTTNGTNCPYCCANPLVRCEHTTFEYLFPELANEWHPTKNGKLLPNQFSAGLILE